MSPDLELIAVGADSGGACNPTNHCINASQTVGDETVVFNALAGAVYFIIVDGWDGAIGSGTLDVTCN